MLRTFKCNFLLSELCSRSSDQLLRFNSSPFLSCPTSAKTFCVSAVNFLDSLFFHSPSPCLVQTCAKAFPGPQPPPHFLSIYSLCTFGCLTFTVQFLCCEKTLTHSTALPGSAPTQPSSHLNPAQLFSAVQVPWVASCLHAVISVWNPAVTLPKKGFSLPLKAQLPHDFPPPPSPPYSHPLPLLVRSTIHPQLSIL